MSLVNHPVGTSVFLLTVLLSVASIDARRAYLHVSKAWLSILSDTWRCRIESVTDSLVWPADA